MEDKGEIGLRRSDTEERGGAGEMCNSLMLEAEKADRIDHSRDKCESRCADPYPARQFRNHISFTNRPVSRSAKKL